MPHSLTANLKELKSSLIRIRFPPRMHRRTFISRSLFATITSLGFAAGARQPQILLRSSWQTVNIGDIAHTPGVLALLEKHLPEAAVRLWPGDIGNGVKEMLATRSHCYKRQKVE